MNSNVFEFTNYDVEVELAGHKFTMDCSTDTGDYLKNAGAELKKLAKGYSAGTVSKENICEFGRDVIDRLLGSGSAETLLNGRKHEVSDIVDICVFLAQIAAKFQTKRVARAENRVQRSGKNAKGK